MSKQITVMGVRYPSISKACETYGISDSVVHNRINHLNWDIEVAITTPINPRSKSVFLDGKLYKSLREVAIEYNMSYSLLIRRLFDGWSLEDAITTPVKSRSRHEGIKTYVRGVYYPSIARAADSYDIRPQVVYNRIRIGWDVEVAITTPVKNKKN